jgi:hypothetical protein
VRINTNLAPQAKLLLFRPPSDGGHLFMGSEIQMRKTRRGPRQKNIKYYKSSSGCCEAPRRLTKAVAADKPGRKQIYPPTAKCATEILRPHQRNICPPKPAPRTQLRASMKAWKSPICSDFRATLLGFRLSAVTGSSPLASKRGGMDETSHSKPGARGNARLIVPASCIVPTLRRAWRQPSRAGFAPAAVR